MKRTRERKSSCQGHYPFLKDLPFNSKGQNKHHYRLKHTGLCLLLSLKINRVIFNLDPPPALIILDYIANEIYKKIVSICKSAILLILRFQWLDSPHQTFSRNKFGGHSYHQSKYE